MRSCVISDSFFYKLFSCLSCLTTVSEKPNSSIFLAVSRWLREALGTCEIGSPGDNGDDLPSIRRRAIQYRQRASERVLANGDPEDRRKERGWTFRSVDWGLLEDYQICWIHRRSRMQSERIAEKCSHMTARRTADSARLPATNLSIADLYWLLTCNISDRTARRWYLEKF